MKIYKVGGCVRDSILGRTCHDIDYVVVGSTVKEMLDLKYKQVGNDFPVFLHPITGEEYALARKEVKTGNKHTDFSFEFGPDITLQEDLVRRDFTMNALALDTETGDIIDYFNGQDDIQNKIIRHVNSEHFIEDPLRVLRGVRFACQLGFIIHESTLELFKQMVSQGMLKHLTPERIWKEIEKALETHRFYDFITILDDIGALEQIFPEVYDLKSVPENVQYHPEGNAYKHVLLTLQKVYHEVYAWDQECELDNEAKHKMALLNFGLLCHDLGKARTNKEEWPAHHGHDELGLAIVNNLCDRLLVPNEFRDYGKLACKYHMKFYRCLESHTKVHYDMVKEITNYKNYERLVFLFNIHKCDLGGREGKIASDRIERMWNTISYLQKVYKIMNGATLKDLATETQEKLSHYKGEKFGKLYRDAMISYLKVKLKEDIS
jgi:tRNA nucleotidyltransferase (CCA-adding enzyme)